MESSSTTYDRLLAQLDESPEAWKPAEAGETIVGEVTGWRTVTTERSGTECEVMTVRTPEGIERSIWTWHAQLRYRLIAPRDALGDDRTGGSVPAESRLARVSDRVAIRYGGRNQLDDGREAMSYRVSIERPGFGEPVGDDDIPF